MPRKDLRANVKGRSGKQVVSYRGTRGRTFNVELVTRTSGTVGTFRLRSGAYKLTLSGKSKGSGNKHGADTWDNRLG